MPYTSEKPRLARSSDQLRAEIPGWGADLDPANRPAYPQQWPEARETGAHWDFPDRQDLPYDRERSVEHRMLTPVFGTSAPLHGVSGRIRRFAYERFSEARAAHWLILIAADRVDAAGSHLRSLATRHPDNPITETGIRAELTHRGLSSRRSGRRIDLRHQWIDPLIVAGPWLASGAIVAGVVRRLTRRARNGPMFANAGHRVSPQRL